MTKTNKNNKSKRCERFPRGSKFSDLYPTKADYTKAKMKFFKANHNGWWYYYGVNTDFVPQRFKD